MNNYSRLSFPITEKKIMAFNEQIINRITRIEAKIHRMVLFGDYGYEDLKKGLGNLKVVRDRSERSQIYAGHARVWFQHKRLDLFYNKKRNAPECQIAFSYPTPEWLILFAQELPDLEVSSAEYAIDLFCKSHYQVAHLFFLLLYYTYFPNQRGKITHFGGEDMGYEERCGRKENAGYRFWNKTRIYAKIYERGPDKQKVPRKDAEGKDTSFWPHEKVDRVRIEITFDRKGLKKDISNVTKLIEHPRFNRKVHPLIQFKAFDGRSGLPKETEDYSFINKKGNRVTYLIFQKIYNRAKKRGINPQQYFKDPVGKHFQNLRRDIRRAMQNYDLEWQTNGDAFLEDHPDISI
jgi:hypothetical protein